MGFFPLYPVSCIKQISGIGDIQLAQKLGCSVPGYPGKGQSVIPGVSRLYPVREAVIAHMNNKSPLASVSQTMK